MTPSGSTDVYRLPPDGVDLERLERELVLQALKSAKGNKTRAGRLLGLNRDPVKLILDRPLAPSNIFEEIEKANAVEESEQRAVTPPAGSSRTEFR